MVEKFATGVADTGRKIATGVVDTGGAPWLANISANLRKNSKRSKWNTLGLGGNWFMKKTRSKKSRDTVPLRDPKHRTNEWEDLQIHCFIYVFSLSYCLNIFHFHKVIFLFKFFFGWARPRLLLLCRSFVDFFVDIWIRTQRVAGARPWYLYVNPGSIPYCLPWFKRFLT